MRGDAVVATGEELCSLGMFVVISYDITDIQ